MALVTEISSHECIDLFVPENLHEKYYWIYDTLKMT